VQDEINASVPSRTVAVLATIHAMSHVEGEKHINMHYGHST